MKRTILLVSRDDELQMSRSTLLQDAGYQAFRVDTVPGALLMAGAERPNIVLLCYTFNVNEQEAFIERVQETDNSLFVLCLRNRDIQPAEWIEACERCFSNQPGMTRVRILNDAPIEYISRS
jgi:DNA-binding response OmpR family regulator